MTLEDTIRRVAARNRIALAPGELAELRAAPADHALAIKVLAAHFFNAGAFDTALEYARRSADLERSREAENNLIAALARAGRIPEAIARAGLSDSPLSDLDRASHLSELFARTSDSEACRAWGRRALHLKDAEAPATPQRGAPVLHRFDPARPERNVIAFSLFGTAARYREGALRNAQVAPYLYPGWSVRFYIDDALPRDTRAALLDEGAQLRRVEGMPRDRFGLFWRFLVEDDPQVDLYLCRDADAVVNIRERMAVQQWLESGQPFHVMRDFGSHSELVLAGMWGAHRGNIGDMTARILRHERARRGVVNSRIADQLFLRREIWPLMRDRTCCHDAVFGHGATHSLPPGFALPGNMHVGQDDGSRRAAARRAALPDATPDKTPEGGAA
ncbi:MAG: hypothetical protein NXH82_14170 [Rhodobacteraceae bacterium]|nr:hypothetical protein [Paracoccaceae bacterium]